jgi:hypothetical protein
MFRGGAPSIPEHVRDGMSRQVEVAVTGGAAVVSAKHRDSVIASQLAEAGLDFGVDARSAVRCLHGQRPWQWLLRSSLALGTSDSGTRTRFIAQLGRFWRTLLRASSDDVATVQERSKR